MSTEVRLWELVDGQLRDVPETSLADARLEKDLEGWIVGNPSLLGEDLLVIGRQYHTVAGPLDLLLINGDGQLAIAELKRDLSAREAVAQALDYASWLDGAEPEEVFDVALGLLGRPLDEAFEEHFGKELPDISPQNHRIVIVASRLDAAAERIVNYLSERHHVNLNATLFTLCSLVNEGPTRSTTLKAGSLRFSRGCA
jgi:endonuclease NucS-like protein